MHRSLPRLLCLLIVFTVAVSMASLKAQETGDQDGEDSETPLELEEEDSTRFRIRSFYPANPDKTYAVRDTQLIYPHTHYDPLRRDPTPYRWLGNVGDPARSLIWNPDEDIQFKTGVHPFESFGFDPDSLVFYNLNASYTHAFFSLGPNQLNSLLEVKFARDFNPRLQMTLHYRRNNQDGIYVNQNNIHTSINFGTRYHSRDSTWSTVLQFTSNVFRSQEMGGIPSDTIFDQEFADNRMTLPVRSPEGETRQQIYHFRWYNRFRPSSKSPHLFSHRTSYEPEYYKSFDPAPDSSYYGPLFTDDRGIRMFLRDRSLTNELTYAYEGGNNEFSLRGRFGLRHEMHWIATDLREVSRSDLGAEADLTVKGNRWSFDALVEGWTLDASGAYKLDLGLSYELLEGLKAEVEGLTQSSLVPYIARNMDDPTGNQWSNPWNSYSQSRIRGALNYLPLDLSLSFGRNRLKDPIYFDAFSIPRRYNGQISWQFARLHHEFKYGIIKARSSVFWRSQNEHTDLLLLPAWYGEHRLSVKASILQDRLLLETGLDVRWMDEPSLPGYMPLTGQFHLPRTNDFSGSWTGGYFLAFRIKRFTGFVRLENLKGLILDEQTYWVGHYPQLDFGWRLGFRWGFLH